MQKNIKVLLICIITILWGENVLGQPSPAQKQGILLVSFGTSYPEARTALHAIEPAVGQAFPEAQIHWAYTSKIIRKKLAISGTIIPSPDQALADMIDQGYTHIMVQSLHIIPGEEYHYLETITKAFQEIPKRNVTISLGKPLMFTQNDILETAQNMIQVAPKLKQGEAMLWMAHGTGHQSAIYYPALQYLLSRQSPHHYLATVEFEPALDSVVAQLKAAKVKTIYLQPFMSIAGDHALNDMAGDEPDSWKKQLEAAGFKVECILKGLTHYDIFVNQWINHMKTVNNENDEQ